MLSDSPGCRSVRRCRATMFVGTRIGSRCPRLEADKWPARACAARRRVALDACARPATTSVLGYEHDTAVILLGYEHETAVIRHVINRLESWEQRPPQAGALGAGAHGAFHGRAAGRFLPWVTSPARRGRRDR